ncbi:MAG: type II secretion system F family protein, partial [Candidatus Igneacidithiobacillus chanchocoensis]
IAALFPLILGAKAIPMTLVGVVLALRLPDFLAERQGTIRRQMVLRSLPDALDLLAISVEAGLGFEGALDRVARRLPGPAAEEFNQVLQDIRLGQPRGEALLSMADRVRLPEVRSLAVAVNQAEEMGVGVLEVLRTQSESLRTRRAQALQEQAMKIPIKMLFPLIFFILPALFVVLLGPIVLNLHGVFGL